MFGSSKVSNLAENAMNNNVVNVNGRNVSMYALLLSIIIVLILNVLVGPWLWNNVLRRLVPGAGRARWYDTVALALLFGLIIPH
jgi:hypothetical protein